jgi:CheY-like chemotaxis protein
MSRSLANRSSFVVALMGFSQTERIALTSMLALSERRALRYTIGDYDEAHLVVADSDNEATMRRLRTSSTPVEAVLVGAGSDGVPGSQMVPRPVEWHRLLRQLDLRVREHQAAVEQPNPDSPPTLPMVGVLDPTPSNTIVRAVIRGTADVRARARGDIAQASKTRAEPSKIEPDTARGHVLLVGASAAVQDFVKQHLKPLSVDTEAFDTPESAIARTGDRNYDCLMIDIAAGGNGADAACRALKSRREGAPRVVLIGHSPGPLERMRARMAGADAVLAKPLSRTQLMKALARR